MDGIPVLSQLKSLVLVASGDAAGARIAQVNFSKQCIVVSQVRSLCEYMAGENHAARQTQREFVKTVDGYLTICPVLGQARGVAAYASGDSDKGYTCMKKSTEATVILGVSMFAAHLGFIIGLGTALVFQRARDPNGGDVPISSQPARRPSLTDSSAPSRQSSKRLDSLAQARIAAQQLRNPDSLAQARRDSKQLRNPDSLAQARDSLAQARMDAQQARKDSKEQQAINDSEEQQIPDSLAQARMSSKDSLAQARMSSKDSLAQARMSSKQLLQNNRSVSKQMQVSEPLLEAEDLDDPWHRQITH